MNEYLLNQLLYLRSTVTWIQVYKKTYQLIVWKLRSFLFLVWVWFTWMLFSWQDCLIRITHLIFFPSYLNIDILAVSRLFCVWNPGHLKAYWKYNLKPSETLEFLSMHCADAAHLWRMFPCMYSELITKHFIAYGFFFPEYMFHKVRALHCVLSSMCQSYELCKAIWKQCN